MRRISVRAQVEARVGETIYSAGEIHRRMCLSEVSNVPSIKRIRDYAMANSLGVTPRELGIPTQFNLDQKAYYVRASNLDRLFEGLGSLITGEQLGAV